VANCWKTRTGSSELSTVTLGSGGDRGQQHRRRGDREVETVVLPHGEHVEAQLVGQLGLLLQLAGPLLRRHAGGEIPERCQAELHERRS